MTTRRVVDCGDCPMFCTEWGECSLLERRLDDIVSNTPPQWCPLRSEPLTLELEKPVPLSLSVGSGSSLAGVDTVVVDLSFAKNGKLL